VCSALRDVPGRSTRGTLVSSSFLYLAIVAVWALVLVPRWLRRQHVQPQVEVDVEVDVEFAADDHAESPFYYDDADAPAGEYADGTLTGDYGDAGNAAVTGPAQYYPAPPRRSRVLQARRRLLTMLLLLTAVAAGCTALKVTSWWVCIPPAVMIGLYLILLRESAVADAEQAHRRAAMESRVQAAQAQERERERAHAAAMARQVQPSAQIIDISARVGDQLYDQYADATVRAVGD
jgi:hypothetical protein